MPRPPKNPEDRKRYQLHVPLTDAQRETIETAAKLEDVGSATWARTVLLSTAERRLRRGKTESSIDDQ